MIKSMSKSKITTTMPMVLILIFVSILIPSALAELTAIVSPGYTFGSSERVNSTKLNQLGLPTISIVGTLDGTNAGISAGSINANMFANSVVDNASLDYTNSSPQALRIKSAGVKVRELSSDVAGSGLAGGSGSALSVNVDDAGIAITNDVLTLKTNLNPNYLGVASNSVVIGSSTNRGVAVDLAVLARMLATNSFTSAEYSLASGSVADTAHGLSGTPSVVRWVLLCKSAEWGYSVGDEIGPDALVISGDWPVFTYGANSTNVFMVAASSSIFIYSKTNPAAGYQSLTAGNWRAKCYARP